VAQTWGAGQRAGSFKAKKAYSLLPETKAGKTKKQIKIDVIFKETFFNF
jgi:hypothetical protein